MTQKWTQHDIPDLHGKIAIITGANTGLGLETAKALAAHGAKVVLAVRNTDKGDAAARILPAMNQPQKARHRTRQCAKLAL